MLKAASGVRPRSVNSCSNAATTLSPNPSSRSRTASASACRGQHSRAAVRVDDVGEHQLRRRPAVDTRKSAFGHLDGQEPDVAQGPERVRDREAPERRLGEVGRDPPDPAPEEARELLGADRASARDRDEVTRADEREACGHEAPFPAGADVRGGPAPMGRARSPAQGCPIRQSASGPPRRPTPRGAGAGPGSSAPRGARCREGG